jgi:hypothetical protein
MVLNTPIANSAHPAPRRDALVILSPSRSPIPAPSATRVPPMSTISGSVNSLVLIGSKECTHCAIEHRRRRFVACSSTQAEGSNSCPKAFYNRHTTYGELQMWVDLVQLRPVLQLLPMQQVCPVPPQVPHVFMRVHMRGEVQLSPTGQQVWPAPPQVIGQVLPTSATHLFAPSSQQVPLPEQPVTGQQAWPGPPQAVQRPSAQPRPLLLHEWPAQQICPAPPHSSQVPLPQASPLSRHVSSAQHCCPAPPHATHIPLEQSNAEAVQSVPAQQV